MKMSMFEKLGFTWAIGGGIILLAWLLIGVLFGAVYAAFKVAVIVWLIPIIVLTFVIGFRTLLDIWGVK